VTLTAGQTVSCKLTSFGANRQSITQTATCRPMAWYALATTYLT